MAGRARRAIDALGTDLAAGRAVHPRHDARPQRRARTARRRHRHHHQRGDARHLPDRARQHPVEPHVRLHLRAAAAAGRAAPHRRRARPARPPRPGDRAARRGRRAAAPPPTSSSSACARSPCASCTRTATRRHEQRAAAIIREAHPDVTVSTSTSIVREYREYERTATTVLDAYIRPIFERYVTDLERELADRGFAGRFLIMRSGGGSMTADAARRSPTNTVLSGPAGGIVGGCHLADALGRARRADRRHRRDVARRVRDRGRRGGERVRGRARALPAADPDLRHPHDRRRRRLDRLARRRPAQGRPAQRRRRSRPGLLRPGRRRADRHRRRRVPRLRRPGELPRRERCGSPTTPPAAAVQEHLAEPLGVSVEQAAAERVRRAARPHRRRRAPDHRRARPRPAGVLADRLRRRRPADRPAAGPGDGDRRGDRARRPVRVLGVGDARRRRRGRRRRAR